MMVWWEKNEDKSKEEVPGRKKGNSKKHKNQMKDILNNQEAHLINLKGIPHWIPLKHAQILMEIKDREYLKWPWKMKVLVDRRGQNKYANFIKIMAMISRNVYS